MVVIVVEIFELYFINFIMIFFFNNFIIIMNILKVENNNMINV